MRILTITSSYPKFDGDVTAPFIESITRELAERGHELTLVLPARSDLSPAPIAGVRFRAYRYARHPSLQVFGYAEALRADVAVRGTTYAVAPAAVGAAIYAVRQELARSAASFDVVHAHWVVPNGVIARVALSFRRTPMVVSLHGSDVFLSEKGTLFGMAARSAFARSAAATACSDDLAERSLRLGARSRPIVVPYGVDTERFRPDAAQPSGEGLVLAAGRLVHKKGFEHLIDAAALLEKKRGPSFRLTFAGSGDLQPSLAARAREHGIGERVSFLGSVARAELPSLFGSADIVAVPSVRDDAGNVDGLPNVLLEAMATGRAIVATTVGGIPQAVRDGEEAVLVPEKDPQALAGALERLLDSCGLRQQLGASARKRAIEEFSWRLAGKRYEDVLGSVTEARGS